MQGHTALRDGEGFDLRHSGSEPVLLTTRYVYKYNVYYLLNTQYRLLIEYIINTLYVKHIILKKPMG